MLEKMSKSNGGIVKRLELGMKKAVDARRVFTDTIEKLTKVNEDLVGVMEVCDGKLEHFSGIKHSAEIEVNNNRKFISKIEDILD